jgi:hypothetical protein
MIASMEAVMTRLTPEIELTRHARTRMQQRSIPMDMIDLLLRFGDCRGAGKGSESYYFTNRSWRRVKDHLGEALKTFERYRNIYLIAVDGVIVTAAHRY